MSVAWYRRKDDEPDEPDKPSPPFTLSVIAGEPGEPERVFLTSRPLKPVPYAPPDSEQDDDVIEPKAVYKPLLPRKDWNNVDITMEHDD
jgi:hypothetical protein